MSLTRAFSLLNQNQTDEPPLGVYLVCLLPGCQQHDAAWLKHKQPEGALMSMCRATHMSIKGRNQAAEQRHGRC